MKRETEKTESDYFNKYAKKMKDLKDSGMSFIRASELVGIEMCINQWPEKWGNNLEIIIYGSFIPPSNKFEFETLGVTIYPEELKNFCVKTVSAPHAFKAKVKVQEKSVPAFIDAIRRIDILLGVLTLTAWGNTCCGWWCWLLHGITGGPHGIGEIPSQEIENPINHIIMMDDKIRRKVEAALYWVSYPNSPLAHCRSDVLSVFSAYFNAFECLVDIVNILQPRKKPNKSEKQELINDYISKLNGNLSVKDIENMYRQFVNPGFVEKAKHALRVCFNKKSDQHINEFFNAKNPMEQLYGIRNKIDHGEIDSHNFKDLALITEKQFKLLTVIWLMFIYIIPSLSFIYY